MLPKPPTVVLLAESTNAIISTACHCHACHVANWARGHHFGGHEFLKVPLAFIS